MAQDHVFFSKKWKDDGGTSTRFQIVADYDLHTHSRVREVDLIVNARVATDPAILEAFVREVVLKAGEARGAQVDFRQTQSFRPGRPVPTHRYATGI